MRLHVTFYVFLNAAKVFITSFIIASIPVTNKSVHTVWKWESVLDVQIWSEIKRFWKETGWLMSSLSNFWFVRMELLESDAI